MRSIVDAEGQFTPGLGCAGNPDGAVRTVASGLTLPNGIAIAPVGATLIVAESYSSRLTVYDIGSDGSLGGWRV